MPLYESMLVTSTKLDEETNSAVVGKFKNLIETNGTLDAVEEWGKRRLAYPINKEVDGIYNLFHFTAPADFPAELERVYSITDGVLRSLVIAKSEEMEKARLENIAKNAAAREAAAKAAAERASAAAEAEAEKAEEVPSAEEPAAEPAKEPDTEAADETKADAPEAEAEVAEEPKGEDDTEA